MIKKGCLKSTGQPFWTCGANCSILPPNMETLVVSLIFFLITAGAAFFPFALALWGRGKENPNVFVLSGALAMVFAAANIMLVHRRSLGKFAPRILASIGLSLAAWMVTYPVYQRWFCPVCFITGGSHKVTTAAGIVLLIFGLAIFFLGWKVTGWGRPVEKMTEQT